MSRVQTQDDVESLILRPFELTGLGASGSNFLDNATELFVETARFNCTLAHDCNAVTEYKVVVTLFSSPKGCLG